MRRAPFAILLTITLAACSSEEPSTLAQPPLEPPIARQVLPAQAERVEPQRARPSQSNLDIDPSTLRDPFARFVPPPPDDGGGLKGERSATFASTPIAELRVTGTVTTSSRDAQALITDNHGVSAVVAVGSPIGEELVLSDGQHIDWRVDRIRDGEVILVGQGGNHRSAPRTFRLAGSSLPTARAGGSFRG